MSLFSIRLTTLEWSDQLMQNVSDTNLFRACTFSMIYTNKQCSSVHEMGEPGGGLRTEAIPVIYTLALACVVFKLASTLISNGTSISPTPFQTQNPVSYIQLTKWNNVVMECDVESQDHFAMVTLNLYPLLLVNGHVTSSVSIVLRNGLCKQLWRRPLTTYSWKLIGESTQ